MRISCQCHSPRLGFIDILLFKIIYIYIRETDNDIGISAYQVRVFFALILLMKSLSGEKFWASGANVMRHFEVRAEARSVPCHFPVRMRLPVRLG
jgi:hypothetical protein